MNFLILINFYIQWQLTLVNGISKLENREEQEKCDKIMKFWMEIIYICENISRKRIMVTNSPSFLYKSPCSALIRQQRIIAARFSGIFRTAKWTNEDIMMLAPNLREQ